jgi:predicted acylesterase/phospholipase RssA
VFPVRARLVLTLDILQRMDQNPRSLARLAAARGYLMAQMDSQNVQQARTILRGGAADPQQVYRLAMALKDKEREFGWARKLLAKGRQPEPPEPLLRRKLRQRHALCTYKDPGLPTAYRLDRALAILQEGEDLRRTKDQETLGLAGAIHKRKWELDGQKSHLERSLAYYRRGYEGGETERQGTVYQGISGDYGYTAINAAFVMDLVADIEQREAEGAGTSSSIAAERRGVAQEIRNRIVDTLPSLAEQDPTLNEQWWFLVTMVEALFGLGRYQDAQQWLDVADRLYRERGQNGGLRIPTWERETFVRQLASLIQLRERGLTPAELRDSEAGRSLARFLDEDEAPGVFSAFVGKMGLALSGGGFRASFFHIGVLARLAELDLLRHVEVLSCVSGGSIVGAHYYLKIRKLLNEKDDKIERQEYVTLVGELAEEFLDGVQENVRTRVGAELLTNLKMIFSRTYTRTKRAGELYEEKIYARIPDGERPPIYLNELLIRPGGRNFSPKDDNWKRKAKVPIIIINAATLNTGHNWQFTATWMGESAAAIDAEIDGNPRLRRMYYREAPDDYKKMRLGEAVAASAAVPGLFPPIVFPELYEDKDGLAWGPRKGRLTKQGSHPVTVRLVDGGVHDNQGNVGLIEQGCNVVVVSDAGGHLDGLPEPGEGLLGVLLRSQGIQNARIRDAQYRDLKGRRSGSLLRNMTFLHLKAGLGVDPVDWIDCLDPPDPDASSGAARGPLTDYGISKDIQRLVSGIRTDLDSFSDAEAFALMTSGYRMAEGELHKTMRDLIGDSVPQPVQWPFLAVEDAMRRGGVRSDLAKILSAAKSRVFKIWRLNKVLQILGFLVIAAAVVGLGLALWALRDQPILTLGAIFWVLVTVVLGLLLGKGLLKLLRWRSTLRDMVVRVGFGTAMSLGGFLAARLHLAVFDRWYLKRGRVPRDMGSAPDSRHPVETRKERQTESAPSAGDDREY